MAIEITEGTAVEVVVEPIEEFLMTLIAVFVEVAVETIKELLMTLIAVFAEVADIVTAELYGIVKVLNIELPTVGEEVAVIVTSVDILGDA